MQTKDYREHNLTLLTIILFFTIISKSGAELKGNAPSRCFLTEMFLQFVSYGNSSWFNTNIVYVWPLKTDLNTEKVAQVFKC